MSALPPKADMDHHGRDVRFVPKADICTAAIFSLFDHPVGARDPQTTRELQPRFWPQA